MRRVVTVLLWGPARDDQLVAVGRELERFGVAPFLLDQRRVLETSVDLRVGDTIGDMVAGTVEVDGAELDLTDVAAAYLRGHDSRAVPAVAAADDPEHAAAHAAAVDSALLCWADLTPAYVVSRPAAQSSNGSKPDQLVAVAAAGFAVPQTLVTNDPADVAAFVAEHGEVIFKSVSAVRSRVRGLSPADLDRLGDVAACPTQFQRRVRGTDVRVHVVGAEVFATEIHCVADDYRYAVSQGHAPAALSATVLPDAVADRCRALAAALDLPLAGIDLRRTPDGTWYCFEVNPSPAFSYYEHHTGQPIAATVAALLTAATLCRPVRAHA